MMRVYKADIAEKYCISMYFNCTAWKYTIVTDNLRKAQRGEFRTTNNQFGDKDIEQFVDKNAKGRFTKKNGSR